ncbi:MFS transporter [Marinilabilia salmonicolor]|uniref:MFS transporter n=1 Tax=Marinilabilia salmonicolor TaxID=989 RepID=UPI001F3A3292|nr:MFS transporter [Marinilabilia salmonicolor]
MKRIPAIYVVFFSMVIVIFGALLLQYSNSLFAGLAATAVMGVGIASSFPVMLGYTASAFPENSGTAFSIVMGIALIGNMILSSFVGFMLDMFGIGQLNLLLISFVIIMIGILSTVKYKL